MVNSLAQTKDFSLIQIVPTGSEAHSASCSVGTGVCVCVGGKVVGA